MNKINNNTVLIVCLGYIMSIILPAFYRKIRRFLPEKLNMTRGGAVW
jgi:hypothetical protein